MANENYRGRCLHEGVSNLRSSKELTCQFVFALSNGEGLSAIWASLNFWFHVENLRGLGNAKNKKGYQIIRNLVMSPNLLVRLFPSDQRFMSTYLISPHMVEMAWE